MNFRQIISKNIFSYIFIGLITNLLNIGIFELFFNYLNLDSSLSLVSASSIATFGNLILNKKYTFKSKRRLKDPILILSYLTGFLLAFITIKLVFDLLFFKLKMISFIAYSLSVIIGSLIFYIWQKKIVFTK